MYMKEVDFSKLRRSSSQVCEDVKQMQNASFKGNKPSTLCNE